MRKSVDYFIVAMVVVFCFLPFLFSKNYIVTFILLELSLVMNCALFLFFLSLVNKIKELENKYVKIYKAFTGQSVKLD